MSDEKPGRIAILVVKETPTKIFGAVIWHGYVDAVPRVGELIFGRKVKTVAHKPKENVVIILVGKREYGTTLF